MRTHILIAALVLSASSAVAAPRSLSTPAPVTPPTAPKIQILEAPQPIEPPKAAENIADKPVAPAPVAAEPAPAEAKPVTASPAQPAQLQTAPAVAQLVDPVPADGKPVEAAAAPEAAPAKQARRKHHHREMSVEHRINRDIRGFERSINRHLGGIALAVPLHVRRYAW